MTAVTEVFGRGQRTTAAIVEYDQPIKNSSLTDATFAVSGRTITRVYANDHAVKAAEGGDGRFVIIELDPNDDSAITFAPQIDTAATIVVSQAATVETATGRTYQPTNTPVINTRLSNLIVDEFQQLRFLDPVTGLSLAYNLYIPKDYDSSREYPLVLFMHDYGVTGTNPFRTLVQGLGAVSFASPEDQARHPAFVLAPQYPAALANDGSQVSEYPDITVRLIKELASTYSIDENRLYATGQSGGCMASIALNIKYPDLFAASLLVAGQWDPAQVAPMAKNKLWVVVSQDDSKAYPGMNAIMDELETNGAKITRGVWNGRASETQFSDDVAAMLKQGPDSNVFYVAFEKGTVIPEGVTANPGAGHVYTWSVAYTIAGLRDWLFQQRK
ncbi:MULTISPECIES: alpha/beta hydrolase-fold protein [unclassified Sinorhizobium]|uniref:alpha/beta hydrolase-fold protein n=1 Tax=unclassified Sinorhizobium TaxID=2613772 RepID=UPI0035249C2A